MYDIGIVGAGPAGATLARLLSKRFRILLLDNARPKCCGGILAPESQRMLARFDLALSKEILVDPQPFAVAVLDIKSGLVRHYARQYVNIDREAFDHWLRSLLPSNVDHRRPAVYRYAEPSKNPSDGLTVHFTEKNSDRRERVRHLVGADGAFSKVRREFFASHPKPKHYIAVQDWFDPNEFFEEAVETQRHVDFRNNYVGIFDPGPTDFYAWTIPKNGKLVVGGAFPLEEKRYREKFESLKLKLHSFGIRFGKPCHREVGRLLRPLSTSTILPGNDPVFLIGEAAGWISPSSAEGISLSMQTAESLAKSLDCETFDQKAFRRNINKLAWNIRIKNLKIPAMFHPWLRKQIMISGLTAIDK